MSTSSIGARAQEAQPERQPEESPRSPWLLIVCCVAQFMVILDLSIVNVALPSIQSSLGFSASALQWVVDAYAITFAGFLMLGGRAADQFGQRRTFVGAVLLFGLASLIGGVAGSQGMLVAARALQGLGGALMAASSLAIITSTLPGRAGAESGHRAVGGDERAWAGRRARCSVASSLRSSAGAGCCSSTLRSRCRRPDRLRRHPRAARGGMRALTWRER